MRIMLCLAEGNYLTVFAFALFRAYVFLNDVGHWNLLFEIYFGAQGRERALLIAESIAV
jgi:hypothetical protein